MTRLIDEYDLSVVLRPVYPIALRLPGFFLRSNPQLVSYNVMDTARVAEFASVPFGWPRPDPIRQDLKTLEIAEEQPYIHRLTRLGAAAQLDGHGYAFAAAVAPLIWNGKTEGWDQGDHLARAAAFGGFDLAEIDKAIDSDPNKYEAVIAQNERDHAASGHWGVPTFVFEGEPFYGQDRVDVLLWRLKGKGLKPRAGGK
jgi:2-hydroxychromene-2-carboxylate isomerase